MENMELTGNGFWKGKKVLITGHTGFKGSWLSLWLYNMGAEVFGYSLESTSPSLYKICKIEELVISCFGDLRDYKKLHNFMLESLPEIVIHMAAQPLVRASYKDPVYTYSVNVMGTLHVLEAIRSIPSVKACINVTTDKCYDNQEWPWGYRENEPLGGFDPYSNSKACSELVTSTYRNSFFSHNQRVMLASARAGNVIGGGDWAEDRLIPDCIRAFMNNRKIIIRNPDSIRPWQHVLEPLSGYLLLAEKLYTEGSKYAEAWNFGPEDIDAKPVQWIVNKMCELWGNDSGYDIDNNKHPHEAHYLKLDCSKAKYQLGWYPRWNLETTIEKIIDWTKAYQDGNIDIRAVTINQIKQYCLHRNKGD